MKENRPMNDLFKYLNPNRYTKFYIDFDLILLVDIEIC